MAERQFLHLAYDRCVAHAGQCQEIRHQVRRSVDRRGIQRPSRRIHRRDLQRRGRLWRSIRLANAAELHVARALTSWPGVVALGWQLPLGRPSPLWVPLLGGGERDAVFSVARFGRFWGSGLIIIIYSGGGFGGRIHHHHRRSRRAVLAGGGAVSGVAIWWGFRVGKLAGEIAVGRPKKIPVDGLPRERLS